MSEKLIISVDVSNDHPARLSVQDALAQVLEVFQLVSESDPETQGQIVWKLVSASMNSPFTVTAEAVSVSPGLRFSQVAQVAKQQKRSFRRNYAELKSGLMPSAWAASKTTRETVNRVLARNINGIGSTRIDTGVAKEKPVVITPDDAAIAAIAVAIDAPQPRATKEQVGSIEGTLMQVATHYLQPAILVIERKSKQEIWCVVPEAFQHEISNHTSVEDVWRGHRVVVRGTIHYGSDGKISRVIATNVRRVETRHVSEEAITDKGFTSGLSVTEYLERLRDGTLG